MTFRELVEASKYKVKFSKVDTTKLNHLLAVYIIKNEYIVVNASNNTSAINKFLQHIIYMGPSFIQPLDQELVKFFSTNSHANIKKEFKNIFTFEVKKFNGI